MLYLVLTMTMFPSISVLSGLFVMLKALSLFNTRQGLVVTYLIFTMPFTIWVMTQYFRSLPKELEEAAYVDGASPLTVFWQILLPLTMPGLISTGLLAFIAAWNEFLFRPDVYRHRHDENRAGCHIAIQRHERIRATLGLNHGGIHGGNNSAGDPGHDLPVPNCGRSHGRSRERLVQQV